MSERDELDRRAAVADVALQDALIEDHYDGRIFAEKLHGNGYEVVPVGEIERLRSYEDANIEGGEIIIELKQEIERLREALKEAELQIVYLHERWKTTSSGNAVLARIRAALDPTP